MFLKIEKNVFLDRRVELTYDKLHGLIVKQGLTKVWTLELTVVLSLLAGNHKEIIDFIVSQNIHEATLLSVFLHKSNILLQR